MLPVTDDRDTGPFFAAAAEGRLIYAACEDCNHGIHPPTPYCPHCGGARIAWRAASGTGTLHAFTTVMHQVHPDYPAPYTVVLVTLDDTPDVRLAGRLDGGPALSLGQAMQVWFETVADGVVLAQWRPASGE
jgi:uncharacterized OB-fold protein